MYRHEVEQEPLGLKWKLLIALAIVALGWLMLSSIVVRLEHHDYHRAECRSGNFLISADLHGDYAQFGNERRSPYYLRMRALALRSDTPSAVMVSGLKLHSHVNTITVPDAQLRSSDGVALDVDTRIFLADDLDLPYQAYTLSGNIRHETSEEAGNFSCRLRRNHHSEWRIPWVDAMMSV